MASKTSIEEIAANLKEPYQHLELGQVNDHAVYLMNFQGTYPMHSHTQDEMYIVLDGEITVSFKSGPSLHLKKGDTTVVRAYSTHSSGSKAGALVLMFKPKEMFPNMTPED